jgi:predicted GIY-YIG superfamily endonuclease
MVNYSKALVYKLECKDPDITDIYVGSTCNFNRRKQQHKKNCMNENDRDYNYTSLSIYSAKWWMVVTGIWFL